jgi:hypothetical protein
MSEQWGEYTRPGNTPEDATETVVGQADAGNRRRYEGKGYTFNKYVRSPVEGPNVGVQNSENLAINAIQGRKAQETPEVDESEVVKEAMEVALRKMTGTWTDAEQIAAYQSHKEGHLLPDESAEMLTGDPMAGYEAIAPKLNSGELLTPLQEAFTPLSPGAPPSAAVSPTSGNGATGSDGTGTPAPAPDPATTTAP